MKNVMKILKQRRIWAGISQSIFVILLLSGYQSEFDTKSFTDNAMLVVQ